MEVPVARWLYGRAASSSTIASSSVCFADLAVLALGQLSAHVVAILLARQLQWLKKLWIFCSSCIQVSHRTRTREQSSRNWQQRWKSNDSLRATVSPSCQSCTFNHKRQHLPLVSCLMTSWKNASVRSLREQLHKVPWDVSGPRWRRNKRTIISKN